MGTRPDNLGQALAVVGAELAALRDEPATADELDRAKENLKGRVVLSLESTGARMNRLGVGDPRRLPLLSVDEIVERIDAVTLEDLRALADELWAPERLSAAGIGRDESAFRERAGAGRAGAGGAAREPAMIRVAVAGAAGRMGQTVCAAVEARRGHGADRRGPTRRSAVALAEVLGDADVLVDFTQPDTALANALRGVGAGVHAVIGTTGFDLDAAARGSAARRRNVLRRAELRDRRGADDAASPPRPSRHMAKAEIIELHHDRKLDAPSGTAARTAELMEAGEVPIHSVRLPGPGRPPGGHPRRRRADADDPPRLDRPRVVHARRAAGGPPGRRR